MNLKETDKEVPHLHLRFYVYSCLRKSALIVQGAVPDGHIPVRLTAPLWSIVSHYRRFSAARCVASPIQSPESRVRAQAFSTGTCRTNQDGGPSPGAGYRTGSMYRRDVRRREGVYVCA